MRKPRLKEEREREGGERRNEKSIIIILFQRNDIHQNKRQFNSLRVPIPSSALFYPSPPQSSGLVSPIDRNDESSRSDSLPHPLWNISSPLPASTNLATVRRYYIRLSSSIALPFFFFLFFAGIAEAESGKSFRISRINYGGSKLCKVMTGPFSEGTELVSEGYWCRIVGISDVFEFHHLQMSYQWFGYRKTGHVLLKEEHSHRMGNTNISTHCCLCITGGNFEDARWVNFCGSIEVEAIETYFCFCISELPSKHPNFITSSAPQP
ncbi:hypothetical protein CEXT_303101 [Caerostris extrusa]|uniref:Uncharacterized protein n=1 Tax=Caerostris extrusa TaxID=172846 RepID=A0AAV4TUP9_CAEEX|nr:hypothetical protein CEXT_303101 [Caerostris extrusa]